MAICHTYADLREVIKRAHAVNTFGYLNCLLKLEGKLVVYENAAVTASDEDTVDGDHGAVHLTALDVQLLNHIRRIYAEHIDVITLVVNQEPSLADRLNVFDLVALDTMDVSRSLMLLV